MTSSDRVAAARPALLYRAACPRCRFISGMIERLSCGSVQRIPVDSPEALQLYDRFGNPPDKLALLFRGSFYTGWEIGVFALPAAMLMGVVSAVDAISRMRRARKKAIRFGGALPNDTGPSSRAER
jgi:hypothetical protein